MRETKTQHLLVVSPGNLFGGLRLSPFDDEARRRRGDTNTSSSADLPSAKNFHLYPTIDITLYFRPPLAHTGIVQIYTYDRRKGSTMDTEGKKAGYGNTMVGRSKRTRLEGALHFYEVDKKGRFLDCRTLADIYGTEMSLWDEI